VVEPGAPANATGRRVATASAVSAARVTIRGRPRRGGAPAKRDDIAAHIGRMAAARAALIDETMGSVVAAPTCERSHDHTCP
jgi:hypothetical protein